jgi:hypothetical protein
MLVGRIAFPEEPIIGLERIDEVFYEELDGWLF